jgi:hypothetical protein
MQDVLGLSNADSLVKRCELLNVVLEICIWYVSFILFAFNPWFSGSQINEVVLTTACGQ